MRREEFAALWKEIKSRRQLEQAEPCALAERFEDLLKQLVFDHLDDCPTRPAVAQFKYLLQEEWQSWRRLIPSDHGDRGDHRCVDDVYFDAYDRLHLVDLTILPLMISPVPLPEPMPQTPAPEPVHRIAAIFIGDEEDDVSDR